MHRPATLAAAMLLFVAGALAGAAVFSAGGGRAEVLAMPARADPPLQRADFVLYLDSTTITRGDTFSVEVMIEASQELPVTAAQIHMNFDPAHLRAVDDQGNPATTVVPGPIFSDGTWKDPSLINSVDNATGEIDFAGGRGPSGTDATAPFVLAVMRFRATTETLPGVSTALVFSTQIPRKTKATSGTSEVTGATSPVTLDIILSPRAVDDTYTTLVDKTLIVQPPGVLSNDQSQDGPLTASLVQGVAHGSLTLRPDGFLTYAPAPGFAGADTFTYQAVDSTGHASQPATVTITVATQQHTIGGTVRLEGRTDHSGVRLTFSGQEAVFTQADGSFQITLPRGDYTVTASKEGFLTATRPGLNVRLNMTLPQVTLLGGDTNGDGIIDSADLAIPGKNLGLEATPWP